MRILVSTLGALAAIVPACQPEPPVEGCKMVFEAEHQFPAGTVDFTRVTPAYGVWTDLVGGGVIGYSSQEDSTIWTKASCV